MRVREIVAVLATVATVVALAFGVVDARAVAVYLDAVGACQAGGGSDAR